MHHRSSRGKPLDFAGRGYLLELYTRLPALSRVVVQSAVQTGKTELLVVLCLSQAGWEGRTVAYVLPNDRVRNRFVHLRVDPLLISVPAYRARLPWEVAREILERRGAGGEQEDEARQMRRRPGASSVEAKRFGKGHLLFLGSETPANVIEFSADTLIVDEVDRCNLDNLALAEDRLRSSPDPRSIWVGNPTVPGWGIARLLEATDRRRWHHRCAGCGHRQPLDFFAHVAERDDAGRWRPRDRSRAEDAEAGDLRPLCLKCGRPFERGEAGSRWEPTLGGSEAGYHLSRLDLCTESLRAVWRRFTRAQGDTAALSAFWTSDLGLPFAPEGAAVSDADLDRCAVEGLELDREGGPHLARQSVVAGVDVGGRHHVVVDVVEERQGERVRRLLWAGEVPGFEAVEDVLERYRVDVVAVDAGPELHGVTGLRDRAQARRHDGVGHPCAVWLVRFAPTPRVEAASYGLKLDDEAHVASVDRTQLLDAALDDLRAEPPRRALPREALSVPGFRAQMLAPRRVLAEKGDRYLWTKTSEPDHYRLADAYARVAADLHDRGATVHVFDLGLRGRREEVMGADSFEQGDDAPVRRLPGLRGLRQRGLVGRWEPDAEG